MEYRQTFINWISKSKLKNITPMDLANNIENSFSICLNYDVWQIRDPKTYSELRNKIILDKAYKKQNKKAYKLFISQSKYYQIFLKSEFIFEAEKQHSNEDDSMKQTNESTFDSTTDTIKVENIVQSGLHNQRKDGFEFRLNNDEVMRLYEFFNKDHVISINFCLILKFALESNNELILDIRTTIAGAKVEGERLRFYSDKNGFLRFSKISKSYNLNDESLNLEPIFDSICKTNKYFEEHPNEVNLIAVNKKEPLGYIFHKTFGFGIIESKKNDILTVKFDNQNNQKKILDKHLSFKEIDKKSYENKIVSSDKKEEMHPVRINWDKYEAALLIEAYWKIEGKQENRTDILTQLSRDLRTRAKNKGIKIDDTFRNLNGMSFQVSAIATSFIPKKYSMHKTSIFDKMANLYLNDKKEFEKILDEAHKQIDIEYGKKIEKPSSILVSDVDFYTYIKESFAENHKNDGKAYRAPQHAKKCIDIVHEINEMVSNSQLYVKDLYSASNQQDIANIENFLRNQRISKSEEETKWFWYVLKRYKKFVENHNSQNEISKLKMPQIFYIRFKNSLLAKMIVVNGKYKVLSGSDYSVYLGPSYNQSYQQEREKMQKDGVIENGKFLKDYAFNSPSAAAIHILGRSANGITEWKLSNGLTLADVLQEKGPYENDSKMSSECSLFAEWLEKTEKMSIGTVRGYSVAIRNIDKWALDNGLLTQSLYLFKDESIVNAIISMTSSEIFKDYNNEKHHMFSAALNKYLQFLGYDIQLKSALSENLDLTPEERLNAYPDYLKVLNNGFENGFAYQNMLRKKRFVRLYEELNGKNFSDTDEQYKEKLFVIGFESEEKIYLPTIVDSTLCDSIKGFIDNSLNGTSTVIYYSVIYDNFSDRLSTDFSQDMLKKFLVYMFVDNYSFEREYLTKKGNSVNLKQELINMFNSVGSPIDISDIYSRLPNIDKGTINGLLKDKDFVVNSRGKSYFYRSIFAISTEQLEEIRNFISEMLQDRDQVSGTELYSFIVEQLPELIELNPEVTELGFKNALKLFLVDEFSFRGDVISSSDKKIDVKELYKEFSRQREKFLLEELENFRDSIHKTYIDFNSVFDVAIRIDANTYIRRDLIEFDIEAIDEAILNYCGGKYISYLDIINFTEFPTIGFVWNYYVLEGFLYSCSKKFSLLCSAYNKEKPVGAIVRKGAYNNFEEVIIDVIKANKLFDKEKAFEYLQENNFILTRKFKNIDLLINEAKK